MEVPLITEPSIRPVIMVDRSKVDLVVVGQYWNIAGAQKIQALVNGDGIPCFWGPDNALIQRSWRGWLWTSMAASI